MHGQRDAQRQLTAADQVRQGGDALSRAGDFLDGCDTVSQQTLATDGCQRRAYLLNSGGRQAQVVDHVARHTGRLSSFVALDLPARRIGRVAAHTAQREGVRIQHRDMKAEAHQHRMLGADLVQVMAVRVATLDYAGVLKEHTLTDDPLACWRACRALAKPLYQFADAANRAAIHRLRERQRRQLEMHMRVDEAWQHHSAADVQQLGGWSGEAGGQLARRADCHNAVSLDGQGVGDRTSRIHCAYDRVVEYQVSGHE